MKNINHDLRSMTKRDLEKKINTLAEEVFRLRCSLKTSQLTDKKTINKTKKDLARAKTIFIERKFNKEEGMEHGKI